MRDIISRWDHRVLWAGEAATVKDAVLKALQAGADLRGAVLRGAHYGCRTKWTTPPMMLLASWGSTQYVSELMRYDAANHPLGSAPFSAWAKGGPCPYDNACVFGRAANFREEPTLWQPGPAESALVLVQWLLAEQLRCEA